MSLRRLLALAAIPVAAAVACEDAYAPQAYRPVVADTLRVSALSGTSPFAASAVNIFPLAVTIPDASEGFDFALDLNANGDVLVIPRAKVLNCSGCQLGMLVSNVAFDELFDGPERGYTYDSTRTVALHQTIAFVTKNVGCAPSNIATYDTYAKMIVDSVRTADRSIFIRFVTDPNCGFRGLVPGMIPQH